VIVVSNSTPLIALSKISYLSLVQDLFGTVGLLLVAKRMGYIPAIRPLLDELIANRFFLSQKIYQSLLTEAGE
jgi:predicted nucleic acid-binding protein